jgi:hypothetical protein
MTNFRAALKVMLGLAAIFLGVSFGRDLAHKTMGSTSAPTA